MQTRGPRDQYPEVAADASVSDLGMDLEARVSFIQVRSAIDPDLPSVHHNGSRGAVADAEKQIVLVKDA